MPELNFIRDLNCFPVLALACENDHEVLSKWWLWWYHLLCHFP